MRLGLVGYGTGGKHFHAPFIAVVPGIELVGVVARAPETIARVRADLPNVPIYPSLKAMLAAGVDAVTITTPPQTRRELVLEAITAGVHVIADKPFAPNAAGAKELGSAALAKGVVLSVFQNRRMDADVRTLKKVLDNGRLGKLWRVHSRMDLDDPATLEAGPTGGLLRDIGSHLVDQMLWLLGPVQSVDAQLDMIELPHGQTDAGFTITLRHINGVHSHLSSSKLNHFIEKEYRAYGEHGSYVSSGTDVQAQAIFAGRRPIDDLAAWGYEEKSRLGHLHTAAGIEEIASEQGRYHDYYEAFVKAVRNGSVPPVTAHEAAATLEVLDAARTSAVEGRVVAISNPKAS